MNERKNLWEVSSEFSAWRASRPHKRSKIPEALWVMACGLLEEYGITEVCEELGLNASQLRLEWKHRRSPSDSVEFVAVEWPSASVPESNRVYEVELERSDGGKLRMSLGSDGMAFSSLVHQFFQEG